MKKSILVIVAMTLLSLSATVYAKEWKKLRVGVEGAYPPFSYVTPEGELAGFDIDIAKAIGEAIGAEVVLVSQDWDGIIPALLARKYDCIIASMMITEERKKKVAFSKKYYFTPVKLVAKKGTITDFNDDTLKGKTIGVQRATITDTYLTEKFGDDINVKRYGTQDEVYLDLIAGRMDMAMADSVALLEGFINTKNGVDFEFVGPDYIDPKWFGSGNGIAIRKQDKDLKKLIDGAIDEIRANGTYKKIQDKYFTFDVYGE